MAEKSIIAVVGATGQQGGGLVRAIHVDPGSPFRARALTRKPNSAAAGALAALGAEVVGADLDDSASVTLQDTRLKVPLDDDRMPSSTTIFVGCEMLG
jgi:dihydrodipicolinate reductase